MYYNCGISQSLYDFDMCRYLEKEEFQTYIYMNPITKNHHFPESQKKAIANTTANLPAPNKLYTYTKQTHSMHTPVFIVTFPHLFSVRGKGVDSQKWHPSLTVTHTIPSCPLKQPVFSGAFPCKNIPQLSQMSRISQNGDATTF